MSIRIFTGIGSRESPKEILNLMADISSELCSNGWILRSGAAPGSDTAFENGCNIVKGKKEIYLPWRNFEYHNSPYCNVCAKALKMASEIHPAWDKLSPGAKKLHARNCYQVLGKSLNLPSNLLVCWTQDGQSVGGTRTAIILAEKYNIPVINLFKYNTMELFKNKLIELNIEI